MRDLLLFIFQDLKIIYRQAFAWVTPLLFFVIVVSLFSITLGNDPILLKKLAPGIIWIAALLATIISMGQLFRLEMEEGSLDLILLSPKSLTLIASCKIFSHWLAYTFPLVLISPLLGFLVNLSASESEVLFMTLLLGTPFLTMIGAIGSALTIGIRTSGLLLPILIMPFYIPVLIFGTGTVMASSYHLATIGYFAILGALFLFALAFAPFLTGVALRIGVNQ